MLVVVLSGVLEVRAATRYRLQYDLWHKYDPPLMTFDVPCIGPTGFKRVPIA